MELVAERNSWVSNEERGSFPVEKGCSFEVNSGTPEGRQTIILLLQSGRAYPAEYPPIVEVRSNVTLTLPLSGYGTFPLKAGQVYDVPRMVAVHLVCNRFAVPTNSKLWNFQNPEEIEEPRSVRVLHNEDADEKAGWVTRWRRKK